MKITRKKAVITACLSLLICTASSFLLTMAANAPFIRTATDIQSAEQTDISVISSSGNNTSQSSDSNSNMNKKSTPVKLTAADELELPIIMYHSILKEPKKETQYVVSPALLEEDLKYIEKRGYTPVFMQEVIDFVSNKGSLPEKPIVITFDDGYYNNYYYAHPLLKKYDMKAVISIVGRMTDEFSNHPDENPSYAHVTWDDILEMHLSGCWEIQNHSYDCHSYDSRNGVCQVSGETNDHYKSFLTSDLCHLQDKIAYVTGVTPNTFTYPFGAFDEATDDILKEIGFDATLSCTEGVSIITKGEPDCLFKLKRHLRPPNMSPDEFFTFLK